jgi:MFS family permease
MRQQHDSAAAAARPVPVDPAQVHQTPARRRGWASRLATRAGLPQDDLLRDATFRRLWFAILSSSFSNQISLLALPLTAVLLLRATPTQMGLLTALQAAPFALLSLPSGVWLDRVRKLPVFAGFQAVLAAALITVPIAWWAGWLGMPWLYVIGFIIGSVNTVGGTAGQIVLTQIVPRARRVEAHARNATASSAAEIAGPGAAGALIKLVSAPLALALNALLVVVTVWLLRGIRVAETPRERLVRFWPALADGLRFVKRQPLLVPSAILVGSWHLSFYSAQTVQILIATRVLGLSEGSIGLCYALLGVGTVMASLVGYRVSRRFGPGPTMALGHVVCGVAWLTGAAAPANALGVAMFGAMLLMYGVGSVLIFINFLAIRQAVTPNAMLGRMTSTMRWLIMIPSVPGALLAGWLGEHFGLRSALLFSGCAVLLGALVIGRLPRIRGLRELPRIRGDDETADDETAIPRSAPELARRALSEG